MESLWTRQRENSGPGPFSRWRCTCTRNRCRAAVLPLAGAFLVPFSRWRYTCTRNRSWATVLPLAGAFLVQINRRRENGGQGVKARTNESRTGEQLTWKLGVQNGSPNRRRPEPNRTQNKSQDNRFLVQIRTLF